MHNYKSYKANLEILNDTVTKLNNLFTDIQERENQGYPLAVKDVEFKELVNTLFATVLNIALTDEDLHTNTLMYFGHKTLSLYGKAGLINEFERTRLLQEIRDNARKLIWNTTDDKNLASLQILNDTVESLIPKE